MRHLVATKDFREGFVDMLPACVGLAPFGVVCGVGAAAAGTDWLVALGMALVIFSGAAQILAAQLYAANAPVAIIVLTCFVLGLRFLMYSASMAPYLRPLPKSWQRGLAFLLTDQAFAAAIRRFHAKDDPRGGGLHFLGSGIAIYLNWIVTNMTGYFAGASIPASWSLDFAVPLCFIALVAPLFRSLPSVIAAVVAGAAVLALAGLPMRLNLVAAGLIGIVAGTLVDLSAERCKTR